MFGNFDFSQMKMKAAADDRYTQEMLDEAMDILEGLKFNMGMFQRQYYGKLRKRFLEHKSLNEVMRAALNEIDCIENNRGERC